MDTLLFLLLIIGFCVGLVGTLIGAGGGFLLVPILFFICPKDPPATITFISLFVVCANATSGSISYGRMKRIDYRSGILFAAAMIVPAILGVYAVNLVNRRFFTGVFGAALVLIGAVLVLRPHRERSAEEVAAPPPKPGSTRRKFADAEGCEHHYEYQMPVALSVSAGIGFVSSFLGIGGGIIHVPFMARVLKFPVHVATATSHFVLAISSFVAVCMHFAEGGYGPALQRAIPAGIGAVVGAQVGARLSTRVNGGKILLLLAVALALAGTRMVWKAISG
jgi:hypothetical protein